MKTTLVIMAAGIGSRFGGGVKQLEPVGPNDEIIMDYSIKDAMAAGFNKVVFVIRKDLEKDFKEVVGDRIAKIVEVEYAYQELDGIPTAYHNRVEFRTKPWGTGQAIMACKGLVDEPFLVINADDYYGKEAYTKAYVELQTYQNTDAIKVSMVGFILGNTLSDNGGVTRGVCKVDSDHMLSEIVETKNIIKTPQGPAVEHGDALDSSTVVSMNMWGLTPNFIDVLIAEFETFLGGIPEDDNSNEYLLPTVIGDLLENGKVAVKVMESNDKWFGVTYKEDKETVMEEIKKLI